MTQVTCDFCGKIIRADNVRIMQPADHAATETDVQREDREQRFRMEEYDQVAGLMANHVSKEHSHQAQEMATISYLAAKMYAMNCTTSPGLAELHAAWRSALLMRMITRTQLEETPAAPATSDAGTGDESNSKNDTRKVSIC